MKKKRSGRTPKLGQHFLTGSWAAAKLAQAVSVRSGETILEIGSGKGALTKELLKTGARVLAIEKDKNLVEELRYRFTKSIGEGQFEIVVGDVRGFNTRSLKLEARNYVVAANIPYYITGEIIRKFLTEDPQPHSLALLVQREVAERVLARDGKESLLSLSVKAYGTPKIIAKVARGNFSPPPSVDSAILLIDNVSREFFDDVDEKTFFKIVRAGFASKRKLLSGNLGKSGFTKPEILESFARCGMKEKSRAEDVPLEKWKALARALTATYRAS